jgi:hypothetical protein
MIKKIIGRENTVDTTSMLSSAVKKTINDGDVYLDSKVINKALELLMRDFKVIHIKKKKEMEDLISRKIKDLRGRPSFYKPYFNSINLKRIMFDPIKVGLIIKILMNFGLVCFLSLVLEADYHVVKKNKDKAYEIACN